MIFSLLAATFTFTATATGVEKGTPVEFVFVGKGSDRDYEAMFVLDQSVESFCNGLEKAGVPRGKPVDAKSCSLWPVGVPLTMTPAMDDYVESKMPADLPLGRIIYTGGTRLADGRSEAETNMPLSVFSIYSLAQSPLVFDGIFDQGLVYNCHFAKALKKGTRVSFTLTWDEKSVTRPLSVLFVPGNSAEVFKKLKDEAAKGPLDVLADFSPDLTVREARSIAQGLSLVDSVGVKINGNAKGRLFYRAFLPLEKWRDPQERLVQPFELQISENPKLWFIEEDWTVEGNDPKLTPKLISVDDARSYRTDTCFLFVDFNEKLETLYSAMNGLANSNVRTWYVFAGEPKR